MVSRRRQRRDGRIGERDPFTILDDSVPFSQRMGGRRPRRRSRWRGDQHLRSVVNKVHASFVRIRVGDCAGGRRADDGVDGDGANITSLRDRVGW